MVWEVTVRTDYLGHDAIYQRLRAEGMVGWDRTEEGYDEQKGLISRVRESGHAPGTGRVLELGCGAGNIAVWLAGLGYEVTGIDISPTAIEWARDRAREEGVRAEFVVGDVLGMKGFEGESFDFVLDGHCLHCIIGKDRERFLSEAYRVLKTGGCFLVDTMCGPVEAGALDGYNEACKCIVFGDVATRYFGLPKDIAAEIVSAGFCVVSSRMEADGHHGSIIIEASKKG